MVLTVLLARSAPARAGGTQAERRRHAGARFIESIRSCRKPSRRSAAAQRLADGQAAPVLRADQAARRAADRVLRGDRHVPGRAGLPALVPALAATAGIWLVAAAAAAFNCLVEQQIDRRMTRTAWRPTAKGELTNRRRCCSRRCSCGAGGAVLLPGSTRSRCG